MSLGKSCCYTDTLWEQIYSIDRMHFTSDAVCNSSAFSEEKADSLQTSVLLFKL